MGFFPMDCFSFLAMMNNIAVDIFVNTQVVLQDGVLEVEMLGQKKMCFLHFDGDCQFAFQKDIPILDI